ncbi:MAG: tetratricopeptide (TPR) repeat protein [Alphaproteobacteria bacterium]|jgi:tetratricopeptide (TPR) repeat protein
MLSTKLSSCYLAISLLAMPGTSTANIDLSQYQANYEKGEYKTVVSDLKSLQLDNFTPEHYELYVASLSRINLDDAEEAANQAIVAYSENADMYLMHASVMGDQASDSIFSALGYAKKALASLEKATALEPNDPKYLNGLMSFYLMAPSIAGGDTEKALALANDISILDEIKGIAAKARYFSSVDDYDNAYITIEQGIESFPAEIELHAQLASLYVREDEHIKAIGAYQRAAKLVPAALSENELAIDDVKQKYESHIYFMYNAHYQIGRVALLGDVMYEKGIQHLDTYISLHQNSNVKLKGLPSTDWALLRKAGLLYASKQAKEAQATLALINVNESERLEDTYKKLSKKVNRAVQKMI